MAPVSGRAGGAWLSRAHSEVPLAGTGRDAGARGGTRRGLFRARFGTVFLGRPRSREAAEAHEVPFVQTAAIGILAVLCVLGGLFGGFSA